MQIVAGSRRRCWWPTKSLDVFTAELMGLPTTLSKALGSIGDVIAASEEHFHLLKSSSCAYIFQAPISPADIAAALASLRRLGSDDVLRGQLREITRCMRQRFEKDGYDLGVGDGPIVTPHFGGKEKRYVIVQGLYKRGSLRRLRHDLIIGHHLLGSKTIGAPK